MENSLENLYVDLYQGFKGQESDQLPSFGGVQ